MAQRNGWTCLGPRLGQNPWSVPFTYRKRPAADVWWPPMRVEPKRCLKAFEATWVEAQRVVGHAGWCCLRQVHCLVPTKSWTSQVPIKWTRSTASVTRHLEKRMTAVLNSSSKWSIFSHENSGNSKNHLIWKTGCVLVQKNQFHVPKVYPKDSKSVNKNPWDSARPWPSSSVFELGSHQRNPPANCHGAWPGRAIEKFSEVFFCAKKVRKTCILQQHEWTTSEEIEFYSVCFLAESCFKLNDFRTGDELRGQFRGRRLAPLAARPWGFNLSSSTI